MNEVVRLAQKKDLPVLLEIYKRARAFMKANGNPTQWKDGHPSQEELEEDIDNQLLYVIEIDHEVEASFVFYNGIDPCYNVIYDGRWLNDNNYGVLHRVATRGRLPHMGQKILDYGFSQNKNIRIDTHEDNKPMQNLLKRNGFIHVGTIFLKNGESRLAFHGIKDCNFYKN